MLATVNNRAFTEPIGVHAFACARLIDGHRLRAEDKQHTEQALCFGQSLNPELWELRAQ